MKTKDRSISQLPFAIFALMLYTFCAAIAVGGMVRVYNISLAYERSNSEYVALHVLKLFEQKRYDEILKQSGVTISEFETPAVFGAKLEKDFAEGDFTLAHTEPKSWCISRGGKTLATLELRCKDGGGEYGLDFWEIEKLTLTAPVQSAYTVQASPSVSISINGIVADDRYLAELDNAQSPFGALPEALSPEKMRTYWFEGLFSPPEVTAIGENGEKCSTVLFNNNVLVSLLPDEQVITLLSAFGEQAACAYAKYITNDAVLDEVLPFFLPESEYYTHLKQFYNGWYNAHEEHAFRNAVFSDWCVFDDRHISCTISFDYWIKMGRHEYTYPSKYSMYFVFSDCGWRVSNLVVM